MCHNNYHINICIDAAYQQIEAEDEIIIVDDHSDSKTQNILNNYRTHSRITLINATKVANRSFNRNLGVSYSRNPILIFLDGDMVVNDCAIREIKNAHCTRPEKAFIGQKHGLNFDNIQMQLYSSLPNYIHLLETPEGRVQLENNPLFIDNRSKYFQDPTTENYRWPYYYTGLCSVEKEVFNEAGGFDENFIQWGSEDTDLGYRVSQICKIGFINNLHGYHIPHMRDVLQNEATNIANIQYMQQKYKTWEFEILQGFYGYGKLPVFESVIARMRLILLSDTTPSMKYNDILIDVISQRNPNGRIFVMQSTLERINAFFGVAIPADKFQFNTAYISDHIFIYPVLMACRILQEALRVAKQVYIFPTLDAVRIPWNLEKVLFPQAAKQHLHYEANDLLSFTFHSCQGNLIKVSSFK